MIQLFVSSHARQRARQRIGWHRRTTERMLERVFYDGLGPDDCSHHLHDFIAAATSAHPARLTRIYGEHLFIFSRDLPDQVVLLTVYPLPGALRSAAHQASRQQHALAA